MLTQVVLANGDVMMTDDLGHERIETELTRVEFETWCANVVTYPFWAEIRKTNAIYFDKVVRMVFRYGLSGKTMLALCEANALYVPLDDQTYEPVMQSSRSQDEEEARAKELFKRTPTTTETIDPAMLLP